MLTMIMLVIDVAILLMLFYSFGEMSTIQEEQRDDIDNHDERLDALEEYADYLREEFMRMKGRVNADDDRADNYVQWRRRIIRIEAGDRARTEEQDSGGSPE